MAYYPISLNITSKRCVVIGGGEVAYRKVRTLLDFGGDVEVISPALCPALQALERDGKVKVTHREYRKGDLEGAFVAIAATDNPAVNGQAAREARSAKALLNVVDVPELSDFIVPSFLRRGDITVAVSTSGRSPALARKIRSELETGFGEEYASLAEVVEAVRSELRAKGIAPPAEVWQAALNLRELLDLLRRGKWDEARGRLMKALMEAPTG